MGWKRVLFCQSRCQVYLQKIMFFPLCTLCFPSYFIIFYVAFLFLYSYRDERVVSWPVVLYLFIYLLLMGNNGLSGGGWTRFSSAMALPWSTFSILVFLYLCLSVVAGLEGLSHRKHEAKAHWHCLHFIGCLSFFCLSLSPSDFIWVKGLALEERFGKGSLGYGLTFGLPLHVFVCCCWGGRVVHLRAWSKSSLTLFSLLRLSSLSSLSPLVVICVNGFVVVCCWWGGMVVVLCALLGICLSICWWGGSACSSANLGAKYLQKIMFFPLCTLYFPSHFIIFYVAFLFLYCYRDERVVSWPVVLYLFIYLLLMGNNGLLRGGWARFSQLWPSL